MKMEDDMASMKLLQTVLQCTLCLTKFSDWLELINGNFNNPTLIVARLKIVLNTEKYCGGPMMASLFDLASKLRQDNKKWEKTFSQELETDEITIKSWTTCFENKCHKKWNGYFFKLMEENVKTSKIFQKIISKEEEESFMEISEKTRKRKNESTSLLNTNDLEKVLKQMSTKIENNDVNQCLSEGMN